MTLKRFLVLLLASSLLLAAPGVLADDSNETEKDEDAKDDEDERKDEADDESERADERADDEKDEQDREVHVSTDAERAVLKYERKTGDLEGELEFEVYPRMNGLVKLKYEEESATGESEFELDVHVLALLEYADEDGDGAFHPDVDRVVQEHRASDLAWSLGAVEDATFGGAPAKAFTATAPLGGNGTFALRFIAAGAFANESGVSLRPTDLKFDVLVTDYPFLENATALAVETRVKQKLETETEAPDDDEDANATGDVVVVSAPGLDLYFAWADTVTVDGVDHAVASTVTKTEEKSETESEDGESKSESKSERTVYLAYPRGSTIVHDPVVGVASTQSTAVAPVDTNTPALGIVLGVAAVAAVAVLARRRV